MTRPNDQVTVQAPAKLNLFLEVTGKRPDGYHEIETVMTAVDLFDEVTLSRIDSGIEIECDADWVPLGRENLAWLAAELAIERLGLGGLHVDLRKFIPAGAGLGGGSSDAAAVLIGAARLAGEAFDPSEWQAEAALLGSDVPFFLYRGTAICRGRGDLIEPLDGTIPRDYVLIETGVHSSTPEVYAALNFKLTQDLETLSIVRAALLDGDHRPLAKAIFNRLESPAFWCHAELRVLKTTIEEAIGEPVHMTGSGSGLFLVTANQEEAQRIRSTLEVQLGRGTAHALTTYG